MNEINRIYQQLKTLDKRMKKNYEKLRDFEKKTKKKRKELYKKQVELANRLEKIYKRKQKTCKHKNTYRTRNCRCDASFKYYIHCKDCKGWIGNVEWDGTITMKDVPL